MELLSRPVHGTSAFTPALVAAAAADSALSWLQSRGAKLPLAPGLPPASFSQWSVHIDPAVGDPFLTSWKAHLLELLRTHHFSAAPPGPPAAPSPPRHKAPHPGPPGGTGRTPARTPRRQRCPPPTVAGSNHPRQLTALPAAARAPRAPHPHPKPRPVARAPLTVTHSVPPALLGSQLRAPPPS